ncbi:MAG: hypothetical protein IT237_04325 [Bacteroidia bacterium]|nr:hypothetical protein [Bacteroidia bacterium]
MWKSVFKELPVNEQIVWVRVTSVYGELAQAQYNSSNQTFTTTLTGVVLPVYQVSRWKVL